MNPEAKIPTHVVYVTAFIQKDDKYLLAKRSKNDPQAGGTWSTPGGKVEMEIGRGVIEATLKKEIAEEVGLTIQDEIDYLGSDAFMRVSGHHVVGLIFLTYWKSGEAEVLEDQDEIGWYSLEQLNNLTDLPNYLQSNVNLLDKYIQSSDTHNNKKQS